MMTGGGDLDEPKHEELADELDELEALAGTGAGTEIDEIGATAEGDADLPVEFDVDVNENDPDPTAGASDIGGLPGGLDDA
jgi:hypothetical protein